jgi:hypothetical protein
MAQKSDEDTIISNNAELMALLLQVGRTFVQPQTAFVEQLFKRDGVLLIDVDHHNRWHKDDKVLNLRFEYQFTREGREYEIRGHVQNRDMKSVWLCFEYYDTANAGFYELGRPTPAGKRFKRGINSDQFEDANMQTVVEDLFNDWENFVERSCKIAVKDYAKEVATRGTREQQKQKLEADRNERELQRIQECETAYQKILKVSGLGTHKNGKELLDFAINAANTHQSSLNLEYAYDAALKCAKELAKLIG